MAKTHVIMTTGRRVYTPAIRDYWVSVCNSGAASLNIQRATGTPIGIICKDEEEAKENARKVDEVLIIA